MGATEKLNFACSDLWEICVCICCNEKKNWCNYCVCRRYVADEVNVCCVCGGEWKKNQPLHILNGKWNTMCLWILYHRVCYLKNTYRYKRTRKMRKIVSQTNELLLWAMCTIIMYSAIEVQTLETKTDYWAHIKNTTWLHFNKFSFSNCTSKNISLSRR